MPKRTFWLVTGAAVGAGSSLWAERKVRRSVQQVVARLQPDALVAEVGRSVHHAAGSAGGRVRDAVSTGRDEMQRREQELWVELAAQGVVAVPGDRAAGDRAAGGWPEGPVPMGRSGPLAGRRSIRVLAKSASYLGK